MNGLDTNVLVRAVVGDDNEQSMLARQMVAEATGRGEKLFIASVTTAEFVWVLTSRYRYSKTAVVSALRQLLSADSLVFQDFHALEEALRRLPMERVGFTDILIGVILREAGCATTWTFDRRAAELAEFTLVTPSGSA